MNKSWAGNSLRCAALAAAMYLALAGCSSTRDGMKPAAAAKRPSLEEQWGIQIASLRLTAAGQMIDFRYRIVDPEKAAQLVDRKVKPQLIDQASHRALGVPSAPKVGSLRQTSVKPLVGRTYFVLFGNPQQLVKPGGRVTIVIGEFRAENLVVE